MPYTFIATAAFGLEATVKREVARLGFPITAASDGRIEFKGGFDAIPKANLWLRAADRVQLIAGEFEAFTFDELFERTKALPWDDLITRDGKFTVVGKSVKSKLFSISDCQAIVKKAVVEKLKLKYRQDFFPETGAEFKIQVALLRDRATLTVDTTGVGLHRRGYRPSTTGAPIKETMAASLIELSYWKKDRVLFDPLCGSGTIAIEAALMARNIAPGLTRRFASERWPQVSEKLWREAREEAREAVSSIKPLIYASDIDPESIRLARQNAANAGVADCVDFTARDIGAQVLPAESGVLITNPPYGERVGEKSESREVFKALSALTKNKKSWSVYVITPDEDFERVYGRKADAKRKLFNGPIKTDYYQFYGEKPKN
ncbi:MAG: class I SAM-dependent RNA methyltransferase [Defluviitaleaceae bacterium]|nr:class I SAM-dependent RNA methyltransferase [Defluviitaleaceae bacterium]MCL2835998.1 class I SAM-dependent RNA methyltransferase [Defluviitaleaceae bacterium]